MLKKVNTVILGLAVLLAFGCGGNDKQDDPTPVNSGPVPANRNCTVIERVVNYNNYVGQKLTDTNVATLNAKGEIEEVICKTYSSTNPSNVIIAYRITHTYNSSGQLIRKNSYNLSDNKFLKYYEYEYDSNGLNTKIKGYNIVNSDTVQGINDSLVYYPDKRLKRYYSTPTVYKDYTYLGTNKVIKKEVVFNTANNQEVVQNLSEIGLDSKRANNASTYLFHIPRGTNDEFLNNIISIKTTNNLFGITTTTNYSYQYNSDNYPVSWTSTNNNYVTTGAYQYNCK